MVTKHSVSRGWHGQPKRHAQAGRIGGLKTALRGTSYFQKIGKLGGKQSAKVRMRFK